MAPGLSTRKISPKTVSSCAEQQAAQGTLLATHPIQVSSKTVYPAPTLGHMLTNNLIMPLTQRSRSEIEELAALVVPSEGFVCHDLQNNNQLCRSIGTRSFGT
jgi:hypothetical protein